MKSVTSHLLFHSIQSAVEPALALTMVKRPSDPAELDRWLAKNRAQLSDATRYGLGVLQSYSGLIRLITRAEHCFHLVQTTPARLRGPSGRINREEWADLMLTGHAAAIAALLDGSLLLSNSVYRLGLAPHHAKFDVVTSHAQIEGTETERKLRALKSRIQDVATRRNRYLHRGEEADIAELTGIEYAHEFRGLSLLNRVSPKPEITRILRAGWREMRDLITEQLQAVTEDVEPALEAVLTTLAPRFNGQLELLRMLDGDRHPPATA